MTRATSASLISATLLVCLACAARSPLGSPLASAQTTCEAGDTSPVARVRVRVVDHNASPLPGVPVVLTVADDPEHPSSSHTRAAGTDGWTAFEVPSGHHYLLSVGFVGFEPWSRIISLTQGCSLELSVTLEVAAPKDLI